MTALRRRPLQCPRTAIHLQLALAWRLPSSSAAAACRRRGRGPATYNRDSLRPRAERARRAKAPKRWPVRPLTRAPAAGKTTPSWPAARSWHSDPHALGKCAGCTLQPPSSSPNPIAKLRRLVLSSMDTVRCAKGNSSGLQPSNHHSRTANTDIGCQSSTNFCNVPLLRLLHQCAKNPEVSERPHANLACFSRPAQARAANAALSRQ